MTRLLVDAVAVYRLTRLATDDSITQPLRDHIIEAAYTGAGRAEEARYAFLARRAKLVMEEGDWQEVVEEDELPPKVAVLVTCRWCAGVHVAVGVIFLRWAAPRFWRQAADMLAMSAAAALLARLED